jgi:hypothetical protein
MKKIIGAKEYYFVMEILMDKNDPIVESNGSYCNIGGRRFPKAFRLSEEYATSEIVFKQLNPKFASRVKRHTEDPEFLIINERYSFALDQYKKNPLNASSLVYDYILNFGRALLSKVENGNVYQKQLIFNKIGRWLYFVEKIENGELNEKVSAKNYRLNSRFTSISKLIRGFITSNNQQLVSVDVSACQPYILSSIINTNFYSSNNDNDFNIHYLFNSLYYKLLDLNGFNYNLNDYPFMWYEKLDYFEIKNLEKYQNIPFDQDFYTYIIKLAKPTIEEDEIKEYRTQFKKNFMYVLFDSDKDHRKNVPMINMFKKAFPGANSWIETAQREIGSKNFSLLIQRAESFIMIHRAAREFHEKYPEAPIFTIHDGLYTNEEHISALKAIVEEVCHSIVGIKPGLKVEFPDLNIDPRVEDIEKEWAKIRPTNTKGKLKEKKTSISPSNVKRGILFLEKVL